MQSSLSRRVLTQSCLNHTTHDHFIDFFGLNSGALNAFADYDCTQVRCRETLQRTKKFSHRRARGADNYCFFQFRHNRSPFPAHYLLFLACKVSSLSGMSYFNLRVEMRIAPQIETPGP